MNAGHAGLSLISWLDCLARRGSWAPRGLEIANVVARHDRYVRVVGLELQAVAGGEAAKP